MFSHIGPSKGLFILESKLLQRCVTVEQSNLVLRDCSRPTRRMLWKWVSHHRLFNAGTSTCLGLNMSDPAQPLGTFQCDMDLPVLWWRCRGNMLYGTSRWKVAVAGNLVVVKRNSYYEWKRYNTPREGPYIHTLLGNAHGMPCALPFKYNNKWYSECTTEGREDHLPWCSTTTRYDEAEKWGFCPVHDYSCEHFWESNQELRACYQFNLYTILTWSQAMLTCQAQGGNLLSITSLAEHRYIRGMQLVGAMVWIGLNHLKDGWGWQWSDGAPLSLVNFTTGMINVPLEDNRQCGVYNSGPDGLWQSLSCESALPYICKKTPNDTHRAEPFENWQYVHTVCDEGWLPHNGFCYQILAHAGSWEESSQACLSRNANLVSLHSLSEVEMVHNSGEASAMWIGLRKQVSSAAVEWSDGSPVTLTMWHQYHPPHNLTGATLCAKADRKEGAWVLVSCDEQLPAMCRKVKHQTSAHELGTWDEGCPEGWKRHSHSCYTITKQEQTHKDAQSGYFCNAPLLTVENRFEQAFVNSLLNANGANGSMSYWIGLMDSGERGEYRWLHNNGSTQPLTFTNWNKHQPVSAYGCVAMSGGSALGQWEVKDCNSHKALSVCKQSISSYQEVELLPEAHDAFSACPPGWESQPGLLYCFKVFHDEKVLLKRSWVEADYFCQALGAQLASFRHYEEQVFVNVVLLLFRTEGRWLWVGFNKRNPEHPGVWEWSDGSPVSDKNDEDDRRDCAVYSDLPNSLMPRPCESKHEWICKVCLLLHLPDTPSEGKSWNDARSICSSFQGSLVAIEDEIEQAYITMLLQGISVGVWIGLWNQDTMKWTNGRPVSYTNWSPIEPKSYLNLLTGFADEPLCTVLSNNHNVHLTGKWYDEKCSEDGYGFVCQKPQDTSKRPTHSSRHPLPDSIEYKSRSYKVVSGNMSWYDAMHMCMDNDSDLVSITDAYHQAFLTVLVNRLGVPHWIGLYSQDSGINYQWSDGSDTVYTHWDSAEDDSEIGECVYMDVNGGWRRADCENLLPGALCHIPPPRNKPFISYEAVCPSTWVKFGRGCYNFEPLVQRLTFEEAREHCRRKGRVALHLFSYAYPVQGSDSMAWVDGSPLDYSSWPSKAPDVKLLTADTCVTTRAVDGVWLLLGCTERLGFVCKTISEVAISKTNHCVLCISGLHYGIILAAVLVAVLIFALLAGALCFAYRRNTAHFRGLPALGSAYYRQSGSQATESDGNVLITELEDHSG
uniref:Phospholipase A2 receptor 1 n=1 Tax=Hippocampus comes TaxID=109280 RepID=A0A3Q2YRI2_HIPCM